MRSSEVIASIRIIARKRTSRSELITEVDVRSRTRWKYWRSVKFAYARCTVKYTYTTTFFRVTYECVYSENISYQYVRAGWRRKVLRKMKINLKKRNEKRCFNDHDWNVIVERDWCWVHGDDDDGDGDESERRRFIFLAGNLRTDVWLLRSTLSTHEWREKRL